MREKVVSYIVEVNSSLGEILECLDNMGFKWKAKNTSYTPISCVELTITAPENRISEVENLLADYV